MSVRAQNALRKVAYSWDDFSRQAVYGGVGAGTGALVNYLLGNKSLSSYLIGGGLGALGGLGLERWMNHGEPQKTKDYVSKRMKEKRDEMEQKYNEEHADEIAARKQRQKDMVDNANKVVANKRVRMDNVDRLEKKRKAEGDTVSDEERQALLNSDGTPFTESTALKLGLTGGVMAEAGRAGLKAYKNPDKTPHTTAFRKMFADGPAGEQTFKKVLAKEVNTFKQNNPRNPKVIEYNLAKTNAKMLTQPGTVEYMEAQERLKRAEAALNEQVAASKRQYKGGQFITAAQRWAHTPTPLPAKGSGFVPNAKAWGKRTGKFILRNGQHALLPAAFMTAADAAHRLIYSNTDRRAQSILEEMQE